MAFSGADDKLEFFKSEAHKYVFFLLNYQGAKLASSLGACWKHYYNKALIEEWQQNIIKVIKTEFPESHHEINEALTNLTALVEDLRGK